MTVRVMTIEDYEAVYTLWDGMDGIGLRSLDDSREGVGAYLRRNPSTCFVAEESGAVVGAVLGGHDGRRGYLYHLAVSPSHRGQGLGRRLVDETVAALAAQGIKKVGIVVYADNDGGNAFWQKAGFTPRSDLLYRNISLDKNNK